MLVNSSVEMAGTDHSTRRVVDLFAGAGGLSLAARQAGFNIVFAVESDKWAAETYRRNFCGSENPNRPTLYQEDINTLCPQQIAAEHFPNQERCDILLGGPPCQGFSTHRIRDAGVDDPRNRLIHRYFDFVQVLRPRAFLMENVPGILWDRHKEYLDRFYAEGRAAGYQLFEPVVIDARDFGVPQRRKRVFILGLDATIEKTAFEWPPAPTHGSEKACRESPYLLPWQDCNGVFGPAAVDDENHVHMNHCAELIEVFANTPINGGSRMDSGRILPCHRKHDGHKDVYGRIDPSQPAPTMTTACINPSKGAVGSLPRTQPEFER